MEENNIDFSECEFIDQAMKYYTYFDFCRDCKSIKRLFNVLTNQGKRFYLWYVYANIHMGETHKNAIWDYLNDDSPEVYINLMRLQRIYKVK